MWPGLVERLALTYGDMVPILNLSPIGNGGGSPLNRFSPSRLRTALQKGGMNQAELAGKMGVSRAALSRILRGLRSPNSRFIAALKRGFPNLPMEYFFEIRPPKEERPGRK